MSDWGQGAKNNTIGWGKGAVNNSIDWGFVHENSWSGDTDIVGLDPIEPIINAFTSRVSSEGGTFEAESCLNTTLTELNNEGLLEQASLVITPNAVEEGKLFSIVPDDGTGDLSVVRATTKTRVNSLGVIESVPINVVALDYTNGSCPSILVEPQRTNLALRSEEFNDASWLKLRCSIGNNSIISPDNTLTADTLLGDGTLGATFLYQNITITSGVTYTISIFAKKNQTDFIQIFGGVAGFGSDVFANFDLVNGVIGTTGTSNISTNIESFANDWYKCSVTALAISTIGIIYFTPINSLTDTRNPSFNNTNHSIYIWGAQLEAGANATSYIPTVASAVTRNADVISKTGISDLIGQSEGTVFMEVNLTKSSILGFLIQLSDGTNNNRVQISFSNSLFWQVTGNNLVGINGSFNFVDNSLIKIAFGYKNGDSIFYINGVEATSLGKMSANIPLSLNRIDFAKNHTSNFPINCNINKTLLFKTRLSNDELQQLTTP